MIAFTSTDRVQKENRPNWLISKQFPKRVFKCRHLPSVENTFDWWLVPIDYEIQFLDFALDQENKMRVLIAFAFLLLVNGN